MESGKYEIIIENPLNEITKLCCFDFDDSLIKDYQKVTGDPFDSKIILDVILDECRLQLKNYINQKDIVNGIVNGIHEISLSHLNNNVYLCKFNSLIMNELHGMFVLDLEEELLNVIVKEIEIRLNDILFLKV